MSDRDNVREAFDPWLQEALKVLSTQEVPQIQITYFSIDPETGKPVFTAENRPNYHDLVLTHLDSIAALRTTKALTEAVTVTTEGAEIITILPPIRRTYWFTQAYLYRLLRFYLGQTQRVEYDAAVAEDAVQQLEQFMYSPTSIVVTARVDIRGLEQNFTEVPLDDVTSLRSLTESEWKTYYETQTVWKHHPAYSVPHSFLEVKQTLGEWTAPS